MAEIILSIETIQLSRDHGTTANHHLLPHLLEHKQVSQNSVAAITRTDADADAKAKDTDGKVSLPSASAVRELTEENLNTVFRLWGKTRLSVTGNA